MKKLKKIMAVALAAVVTACMSMGVMAANPEPGEFTHGEFSQTAESDITATNLTAGDSIGYFKLVEWDTTTSNWKLTTIGSSCGVTLEELLNGITEVEATAISSNVTGTGTAMTVSGTTGTATVAPGLYFLRAVSTDNNTVYNPAFVSADYYAGGNTVDLSSAIGSSTVLKKSSVPFDKEVTGEDKYIDTKPGDIIPYKITTKVPSYGTAFTNPVFTITDTLSTGLELNGDITVKYGNATTTETVEKVVTITKGTPSNGFTVEFDKQYLTGLAGATPDVEITYTAKVITAATNNVTYMDNKAKLTYSNKPGETADKEDITRHYTFSIDGNLLGATNDQTDELIKVACDADGNPIYDTKTTYYDKEVNPLDGAAFTLTPTGDTPGTAKTYTSADGGHIQFLGLDAGTYELVETSAPAGYVKDSKTYIVEIIPHYDDATSDAPILESYDVKFKIKGTDTYLTTATFEATAEGGKVTSSTHAEHAQVIGNTPGQELPSTGGMGTTLFYIVGGVLVAAAGLLLLLKKRDSEN